MIRVVGDAWTIDVTIAGALQHLLEVVEDDDHRPLGQVGQERVGGGALRAVEEADAVGDRRRHLGRIGHVGEGHEPGAVRMLRRELPRSLDGQARLPDPTGTGQRDQPGGVGQVGDRG